MKRIGLLLAAVAVVYWLGGCKSGTTSPSETPDYMPMASGNYWVYERYELDSSGQQTGSAAYDSVVVGAATQLSGRTAYPFYTISSDGSRDTTYYSRDADGTVWQYMSFSAGAEYGLPELSARWVKVATVGSETNWTVLDTTMTVTIPNVPVPLSVQFKVTGSKGGTETVTLSGKSYTVQNFSQTLTITVVGGLANANATLNAGFVSGIGRVKSHSTWTITITGSPTQTSGSEDMLVRWRIK
ncbi:MAG: hypothetical protein N2663_00950 [Chlorobi bacterium]|nr:hypothetical protein [Chlorobiota bacterium]